MDDLVLYRQDPRGKTPGGSRLMFERIGVIRRSTETETNPAHSYEALERLAEIAVDGGIIKGDDEGISTIPAPRITHKGKHIEKPVTAEELEHFSVRYLKQIADRKS